MAFKSLKIKMYSVLTTDQWESLIDFLIASYNNPDIGPIHSSRHSAVRKIEHQTEGPLFLKSFRPEGIFTKIKDSVRGSRAYRGWRAGEVLKEKGFCVPEVIAIGEKRLFGFLLDSFMATLPLKGTPLLDLFLPITDLMTKRKIIRQLGSEVGRMHKSGIVHGDLIPGNIFVKNDDGKYSICLLDNESTREVSSIVMSDRIRNLVQLNRVVIPRITVTDRLRFFDAYLEEFPDLKTVRRDILKKVTEITYERVTRHRGLVAKRGSISFRQLMAWKGEID